MLFEISEPKYVTIGNKQIGEIENIPVYGFITAEEKDFIALAISEISEAEKMTLEYCEKNKEALQLETGDVLDAIFNDSTNAKEVKEKLQEVDIEGFIEIIKRISLEQDKLISLKAWCILNCRWATDVEKKEQLSKYNIEDLAVAGRVLSASLFDELNCFFESENANKEYNPLYKNHKDNSKVEMLSNFIHPDQPISTM
jgi:hypothetical protein